MKHKKLTLKQKCKRCGYVGELLEKHHKKHKIKGGSDANPNRIYYCSACHDVIHAKAKILEAIKVEEDRIVVLRKRLEIVERLNTPALISSRRNSRQYAYQGYFAIFNESLPAPSRCVVGLGGYRSLLGYGG